MLATQLGINNSLFLKLNWMIEKIQLIRMICPQRAGTDVKIFSELLQFLVCSSHKAILWHQMTWYTVLESYGPLLWCFFALLELDIFISPSLSLYWKKQPGYSSKHLILCSTEEIKPHRFETTWHRSQFWMNRPFKYTNMHLTSWCSLWDANNRLFNRCKYSAFCKTESVVLMRRDPEARQLLFFTLVFSPLPCSR